MLFVRRWDEPRGSLDSEPPGWAYATLAFASVAALIVWFTQAPAPRFVIADVWILFASVFAWAIQKQWGRLNWNAAMIGLACTLPVAAFVLLHCLGLSGNSRPILALLSLAALWMVLFGITRNGRHPRSLAVLCLLPALFQYGERSAAYVWSGRYGAAMSMLWLNVSRLPRPNPPTPIPRQTRSGLEIYGSEWSAGPVPPTLFETPLPNTKYFNPFLHLRTARMKDEFRVALENQRK